VQEKVTMSTVLAYSGETNIRGKYRMIAELGYGGMARVYLAVVQGSVGFHKLVVLKQLHEHLAEDPELVAMFFDEARLAARLGHANIVQTNEVVQENGRCFIVMEYLEGQPLSAIRRRLLPGGALPLPVHVHVLVNTLAGLHHAHELTDYDGAPLGLVHRDATPQNVFVTYHGAVKVIDFGVAKTRLSSCQTRAGAVKGKVTYMAPEQVRGETVDRRADVFAVGVMLWEAATGLRLWQGVSEQTMMKRLSVGRLLPPRAVSPDVPVALEAIILKALAPDREDRYATAAEMQAALEAYLEARGERVEPSDLGALVAAEFTDDRARIKGVVEEQLCALRTWARRPRLRTIDEGARSALRSALDRPARAPAARAQLPEGLGMMRTVGGALAIGVALTAPLWSGSLKTPPAPVAPAEPTRAPVAEATAAAPAMQLGRAVPLPEATAREATAPKATWKNVERASGTVKRRLDVTNPYEK
jgi:eukaryotic-like serine/threonine-protein kinase